MITPLFYPGQQVICVNGDFSILLAQNPAIAVPKELQVYTVRRNYQFTHDVGITLAEIENKPVPGSKIEPNYAQGRFAAFLAAPTKVREEEVSYADAV